MMKDEEMIIFGPAGEDIPAGTWMEFREDGKWWRARKPRKKKAEP